MKRFPPLPEYENFIYTIQLQYPSIRTSTLVVVPRGAYLWQDQSSRGGGAQAAQRQNERDD